MTEHEIEGNKPASVNIGQVCLSDELTWHAGQATANEGHKLVTIFLGTTATDKSPDVDGILCQLGWSKGHFYEVQATGISGGELRTLFSANGPAEATQACIRYCKRALREFGGAAQIQLVMVRIGRIDSKGTPQIQVSKPLFGWNAKAGVSLDAVEEQLTK